MQIMEAKYMVGIKRIKRRAPGGGMKPRGPFKSNVAGIGIRIRQDVRDEMERLAEEHGDRSLSQEAQAAMAAWIARHRRPDIARLSDCVALIALQTEKKTGESIADNPHAAGVFTDAVRESFKRRIADPNMANVGTLGQLVAGIVDALVDGDTSYWLTPDFDLLNHKTTRRN